MSGAITFRTAPLQLADFAGDWQFRRRVTGAEGQETARVSGLARFSIDDGGLACQETGEMSVGGGAPFRAERRTLWRAEPGRIVVQFSDGRPFHSFDPAATWAEASHDCTPDFYRVVYDFGRWPAWRAIWRVTGPRKNYVMTTDYARE